MIGAVKEGDIAIRNCPPGAVFNGRAFLSGPLRDNTVVARFTVDRPAPEMEMDGKVSFVPAVRHRAHDNGSSKSGKDWLLDYVRDEVAYCLDSMATLLE